MGGSGGIDTIRRRVAERASQKAKRKSQKAKVKTRKATMPYPIRWEIPRFFRAGSQPEFDIFWSNGSCAGQKTPRPHDVQSVGPPSHARW